MYQVIFKMDQGTSIGMIDDILPSGWIVDETGSKCKVLTLINDLDGARIGHVQILSDEVPGKIQITADEESTAGKQFWKEFGMMYTELDPFDLRFGVIFLSDGNVAELVELSKEQVSDPGVLEHYSMVNNAFQVSFYLGDWHCRESLQVQSIARIKEDGTTFDAPEMPKQFVLGS